jgi:hypothetical protein
MVTGRNDHADDEERVGRAERANAPPAGSRGDRPADDDCEGRVQAGNGGVWVVERADQASPATTPRSDSYSVYSEANAAGARCSTRGHRPRFSIASIRPNGISAPGTAHQMRVGRSTRSARIAVTENIAATIPRAIACNVSIDRYGRP